MKWLLSFGLLLLFSCSNPAPANKKVNIPDKKETLALKKDSPNPYVDLDVSTMDMSYFPVNYPTLKMKHLTNEIPMARVIYSRPHKGGRTIFGGLVPYNMQWRLGANEASEIEFFTSASIQNKKINPGKYIIYCIPQEKTWTIILNNDVYTWGKEIDSTKDILHFQVPVERSEVICEYFTMLFQDNNNHNANLLMAWDDCFAKLPIQF